MSFDAARVHGHRLPDGTSFDVCLPARCPERVLVSAIGVVGNVMPRISGVQVMATLTEE